MEIRKNTRTPKEIHMKRQIRLQNTRNAFFDGANHVTQILRKIPHAVDEQLKKGPTRRQVQHVVHVDTCGQPTKNKQKIYRFSKNPRVNLRLGECHYRIPPQKVRLADLLITDTAALRDLLNPNRGRYPIRRSRATHCQSRLWTACCIHGACEQRSRILLKPKLHRTY